MPSEYTGFRTISWEWDEVVCSCLDPIYGFPGFKQDNTVCQQCKKLARWQLLTCTGCTKNYIFTFRHHARALGFSMGKAHMIRDNSLDGWAVDKGLCWNCICKKDPATEDDVPPRYTEPPRQARSLAEINLGEITFDL